MTDQAIALLAPRIGTRAACAASGVAQASWYRRHRASPAPPRRAPVPHRDRRQPRALAPAERPAILAALHSRAVRRHRPGRGLGDPAGRGHLPRVGVHLLPAAPPGRREPRAARAGHPPRRRQARAGGRRPEPGLVLGHHQAARPGEMDVLPPLRHPRHLLAAMPSAGWSPPASPPPWPRSSSPRPCAKQRIGRGQLTIHADRGSSMTSKPVALLLADLGVTQSHSRPHVSNDNPYSEAQFKTLKYRPGFPARFASIEAARAHCQELLPLVQRRAPPRRPGPAHRRRRPPRHAAAVQAHRAGVLTAAYREHPERFVRKPPAPPALPATAWINPPTERSRRSVRASRSAPHPG